MEEDKGYQVQIKTDPSNERHFPKEVVIISIMNSPIFPGMIAPIILTEEKFTPELESFIQKSGYVALNLVKYKELQKTIDLSENASDEAMEEAMDGIKISSHDIYRVGVLCKVVKKLKLPDGSVNILVHGIKRFRASKIIQEEPLLVSTVEVFEDIIETDEELAIAEKIIKS